ncbi:MAG TPA: hypothetical protein VEV41_20340 [Terriglobales bacterium]|nr:hypothetical protein [Terriglobales bacterium]
MHYAMKLANWEGMILLAGFFGIVFWKLLTGGISLHGLLEGTILDRSRPDGPRYSTYFSAGRAQLLMITIFSSLYYLLQVIHDPSAFPKLPDALVAVLGGSQVLYLGGKAQAVLLGRLRDLIDRRTP